MALKRSQPGPLRKIGRAIASGIKSIFPELEAGRMARRLANWIPSRAHVNTLIAASGKTAVARSRYLVRNNAYAAAAVECFSSNLVGTGITPEWPQDLADKEAIEKLWRTWTDEADSEGVTDFYGLQKRIARELFVGGECFVRRRPRYLSDGLSVPLQLELLPSEQLPTERNFFLDNGNRIRQGIEFDKVGRRVAYHFWQVHPGDITQSMNFGKITRVPAADVLHIYDPIESGQLRGLPRMAPTIVALWILDGYEDAEAERKKTAALFSVFVTREDTGSTFVDKVAEAQGALSADGDATIDLQPASVHQLAQGEKVTVAEPADVGPNFEAFLYRSLTRFCAAVGLPYAGVTGDMVRANYGNQRAAMLEARRRLETLQDFVMAFQLCRPVARWFMDAAVLSGALSLKGYARDPAPFQVSIWTPPAWYWIDPLKDIQAEIFAVNSGFKARSMVIRAQGNVPIAVDKTIAEDDKRAKSLGIVFPGTEQLTKLLAAAPPTDEPAVPATPTQ